MRNYAVDQRALTTNRPSLMIKIIAFAIIVFITWSNFAPLDEIVRGGGKVVPSSKAQVIQSLEGGILDELKVWEGKIVEKGDVLARLSDAQFDGSFRELESDVTALTARLLRLEAELNQAETLTLPSEIWEKDKRVAQSEVQFFQARQNEYKTARSSLVEASQLQNREVTMLKDLTRKKIAPEIDLLNARQAQSESKAQLATLDSEYKLVRSEEYAQTLTELKKVKATMAIRQDQLDRTTLVAPVRGIVNAIHITTIGGVAPSGEPILEITPLDDELRVEAKIKPKDVAFVRPNMRTTVKLTAYDYTIYGALKGKVLHVSSDTFEDQNFRDSEPYYKALISVDSTSLIGATKNIDIRPGMIADVELHIGQKTVLQYLLKPLFKSKEAFREP